jgi:hypothetical protein
LFLDNTLRAFNYLQQEKETPLHGQNRKYQKPRHTRRKLAGKRKLTKKINQNEEKENV